MSKPTIEDIQAQLKDLNIDFEKWAQTPGGRVKAPILERQRKLLIQLRELLDQQVSADKEKLSELHATVQRIKHGGGV